MRLKLDENLGCRGAEQLRLAGHDVHTVHDEGLAVAMDQDVYAAAVDERRVFVTMDLDFTNPLRFPPGNTAGVAVLRVRPRPGRNDLDDVVTRLVAALGTADVVGRLWFVERERVGQYEEPC